ncbi:uncharacterized protein LOC143174455 [Nomia melanderi]|uniref:uncharacterized protein LOC143174455 n=1 Tax=Nomia melanderi TaxID=2448451 RepID=UPI003FCCE65B
MGVGSNILHFLADWMYVRKAQVVGDVHLEEPYKYYHVYKGEILVSLQFNQFADDIELTITTSTILKARQFMETAIGIIQSNLLKIDLELAEAKTQFLVFDKLVRHPGTVSLRIGNETVYNNNCVKFLGIYLDHKLRFDIHIQQLVLKCSQYLNIIKFLRNTWWGCEPQTLLLVYSSTIRSRLDYASMWYYPHNSQKLRNQLERIQVSGAKIALGLRKSSPNNVTLAEAKLPLIYDRAKFLGSKYILKILSCQSNPLSKHSRQGLAVSDLYPGYVQIFTDGSKMDGAISTGTSYVCPLLDCSFTRSLNHATSIFSAECHGILMAVNLANKDRSNSYIMCSDSLSALEALDGKVFCQRSCSLLKEIKEELIAFETMASPGCRIEFVWLPSHRGILGNERADAAAKPFITDYKFILRLNSPAMQIVKLYKARADISALALLASASRADISASGTKRVKGDYVERFRKYVAWHTAVWVSRYRVNHYNLAASLARVGIIRSSSCECGFELQDLCHILWDCPRFNGSRTVLTTELRMLGWNAPFKTETFLIGPDMRAIKAISKFLVINNLRI